MGHVEVATIDFGAHPKQGCISIFPKGEELPCDHGDIRLRDTLMFHEPYVQCGGSIRRSDHRSDDGREGFICGSCGVFWSFPPHMLTLRELVNIFHHRGFACVWQHSRKVVCDGPA